MKINQSDLAKKLNISKSTISRALANDPKIKKSTRKKVHNLAKKLNYLPNLVAKSLKNNKSNFVGLFINDITNPFYPEIVKGIEETADINGYNIILCATNYTPGKEIKYINVLNSHNVEGIIIITYLNYSSLKLLKKYEIPFVLTDIKSTNRVSSFNVFIDQERAGFIATEYLISLNHAKIALLTAPSSIFSSGKYFKKGYIKALNKYKLNVNNDYIIEEKENLMKGGGYRALKYLLTFKKNEIPTGIICISDIAAIGAYEAIYESNYNIPKDFSIIGNDNIEVSKYLQPPLTTVSQQNYTLGKESFNLLLNVINKIDIDKKDIKLLPELIIRKSTRQI